VSELRDKILGFEDPYLKLRPEVVPEWDLTVYIRGWSAKELDEFEKDFGDLAKVGKQNLRARIAVRGLFDESGARIFSDEDAGALGEKNSVVIDRLFTLVMGLGTAAAKRDDALKNSPAGQGAGSP
jgi:hypothetical protein